MWKQPFSLNRVGHSLIPHRRRKPRFIAWVKAFLSWLVFVKENLYLYWDETVIDASTTPQIKYLERILNLKLESAEIYIDEDNGLGPWIEDDVETDVHPEFYMGDGYLDDGVIEDWVYSIADDRRAHITVFIPETLVPGVNRIAAIVQKYKLPGKLFNIRKII